MTILLPHLLLRFSFDWEDISNTWDSVSSAIQTPRIPSKIHVLCYALYFQLSSLCLDILMKHCLLCLKYYLRDFTHNIKFQWYHSLFEWKLYSSPIRFLFIQFYYHILQVTHRKCYNKTLPSLWKEIQVWLWVIKIVRMTEWMLIN